jgi:hypothetical protein
MRRHVPVRAGRSTQRHQGQPNYESDPDRTGHYSPAATGTATLIMDNTHNGLSAEFSRPGIHGDPERPAPQLLYVTIASAAGEIRPVSIRSTRWGAKRALTPSDLGAGERDRTADLPFTRRPAPRTVRASCTDGTRHRTDSTRCTGNIHSIVPRNVPRGREAMAHDRNRA